jgi:hypothetical protein
MRTAKHLLKAPKVRTTRFDDELLRKLKEAADKSLRSVNAEINYRLGKSFDADASERAA